MSLLLMYSLSFLVLCCVLTDAATINNQCKEQLTHNNTHKHLKYYLGYVSDDIVGIHTDKTYKYKIGVCTEPDKDGQPGCAIIQYEYFTNETTGKQTSRSVCVGKVGNSQVAETNDHVWVELTYTGGDQYGSHCKQEDRKGRLIFVCDPLITGTGTIEFLEENRDDDLCYYLFVLASKQVCGSQLSPGDIIMIIFACLVVVILILMGIGVVYKRIVLGSKGWEQIPLIGLIREFGNLEADGCDLVCRSRNSVPPSQYKPTMPSFATETDEETDEEKDDNLLPM